MEKVLVYLVLAFYSTYIVEGDNINSPCGGDNWIAYKNEKCFKLLKTEEACIQLGLETDQSVPILASRTSIAEQEFLMKNVYNSSDTEDAENWILCQKPQNPIIKHLQQSEWNELQDSLKTMTAKLEAIQNNPVPLDFVYVQLPGQLEPYHVWHTVTWADITSEYAGLFFRVLGGDSAQFTVTQAENSPRISNVGVVDVPSFPVFSMAMPTTGWSSGISSGVGNGSGVNHWGLRFHVASGEVRPRNTAVKIWKRVY